MTRPTDFEAVKEFNTTFGVPVHDTPREDIFTIDKALLEYRLKLIREEVAELEQACIDHNIVETIDALADIIYVVQGMASSLGINLDKAFDIVHQSNMSKVCKDEDEAQRTVAYYEANRGVLGYDSPAYRKSADGRFFVVYNKSTMKILKSVNYTRADFSSLLTQRT